MRVVRVCVRFAMGCCSDCSASLRTNNCDAQHKADWSISLEATLLKCIYAWMCSTAIERNSHTNCNLANVVPHICHLTVICQSKCMVKASQCHVMLRRIEATQPQVVPKLSIADPCRSSLATVPPCSVSHDKLCVYRQHEKSAYIHAQRAELDTRICI